MGIKDWFSFGQIQVPENRTVRRHCFCHRYLLQPGFIQISTSMLTSAAMTYSLSPTQDSSSSQTTSVMYHLKFFSGMKYLPSDLWPQAITCQGNLVGLNPLTDRQYKIFRLQQKCPWSTQLEFSICKFSAQRVPESACSQGQHHLQNWLFNPKKANRTWYFKLGANNAFLVWYKATGLQTRTLKCLRSKHNQLSCSSSILIVQHNWMPAFPAAKWAIDIGCLSSEYIICSEDNDTKGIPDNRLCHIVGKLILGQHYKEQNFLFVTDVAAFLPIFFCSPDYLAGEQCVLSTWCLRHL